MTFSLPEQVHTKESIEYFTAESSVEMGDWLKSLRTCAFGLPAAEPASESRSATELSQTNGNYEEQRKLDEEKREENESANKPKPIAGDQVAKKSILLLSKQPKNEDNILYCSVDQKQPQKIFRVTVGQSEAAIRCSLQICASPKPMNEPDKAAPAKHYYYLVFNTISINLVEDPCRPAAYLYEWNFRNIRRYGCTIDSFSIEVGRKSKSGAGLFLFYTFEGSTIFQLLAKHVNDLKNEVLTGGNAGLLKELTADLNGNLNNKCRPTSTLINIQPNKYEPVKYESTKYDSTANSPSLSSTSIKSSSCTSNESNLSDSAQSNSGDFTSLNEQKSAESAELLKSIHHQKFANSTARHHQLVSQLNLMKVSEKISSQSLPVARPISLLKVDKNGNQSRENLRELNEIKVNHNNPFLANYCNEIGNENKTPSDATIKTLGLKASIALKAPVVEKTPVTDSGLPSKLASNFSGKLLGNFPAGHKQMNSKCCSVVNLIEDRKLTNLNKLNKSLPQINQVGVVGGKPPGQTNGNQISYSSIISVDASANSFNQPNALAKPPRLSKLLLSGELAKSAVKQSLPKNETALSKLAVESGLNEKLVQERALQKIENETKDEEPIFESRQDLFGYRKEENHYEVADELDEIGKEAVKKPVNESPNSERQANNSNISNKEQKNKNSLLPIDTYELLVNTILNQIDEKSFNTATLKEAIKKAMLNDAPSISRTKTEDELLEDLLLSNHNNNDGEQATINYCVNDCEYAKIMKKKFMKKTIVEHF